MTVARGGIVTDHRVLITGATGLLGRQVLKAMNQRGWITRGLGFGRASGSVVRCDLLNSGELEAQFDEFNPTIVIHCAAERRPDVLEGDKTYATKINVNLTRDVGKLCRERGVWLVYISTNYVFDGKDAPYAEDAVPKPVNSYGESKHAGEVVLSEVHPDAAVVRVPLLYGPIEYIAETSVTALLSAMQKDAPKFDNWQERFPTNTDNVALVLEAFCAAYALRSQKCVGDSFSGIFHWQANERHTKYTMAKVIAEIAGIDATGFVRVDDAPPPGQAPRPQFERMLCGRMERLLVAAGEGEPDTFRSCFSECLNGHLKPFVGNKLSPKKTASGSGGAAATADITAAALVSGCATESLSVARSVGDHLKPCVSNDHTPESVARSVGDHLKPCVSNDHTPERETGSGSVQAEPTADVRTAAAPASSLATDLRLSAARSVGDYLKPFVGNNCTPKSKTERGSVQAVSADVRTAMAPASSFAKGRLSSARFGSLLNRFVGNNRALKSKTERGNMQDIRAASTFIGLGAVGGLSLLWLGQSIMRQEAVLLCFLVTLWLGQSIMRQDSAAEPL